MQVDGGVRVGWHVVGRVEEVDVRAHVHILRSWLKIGPHVARPHVRRAQDRRGERDGLVVIGVLRQRAGRVDGQVAWMAARKVEDLGRVEPGGVRAARRPQTAVVPPVG